MSPSRWFQRLSPRPDAALRLFCFHHAGGSAALYRLWPKGLPGFDVCAVQFPGRANRLAEAPLDNLPAIVQTLLPEMLPLIDRPYALFGHSMGSAVATHLAHALIARGARAPEHLFVSGRQPPHLQYPGWTLEGKTDVELLQAVVRAFGGLPPEITSNPEMVELVLPALVADLRVMDSLPKAPPAPLPVPITAIGGAEDPYARIEHLQAWNDYTDRGLVVRHLPGSHFYLDDRFADLVRMLRHTLRSSGAGERPREAA